MLYFVLLSLAPNWQGIQWLNAPAFVEHYKAYQKEHATGDIFDFIKEHYFSQIKEFDKDHEKLPLKSTVQTMPIYIADRFEIPEPIVNETIDFAQHVDRNNSRSNSFIAENFHRIWHPPQLG